MFIFQLLTDEFNIYQSSFYLYINLKELSDLLLEQSNLESVSQRSQDNCQLVPVIPQMITPDSGVGVEGLVGGVGFDFGERERVGGRFARLSRDSGGCL